MRISPITISANYKMNSFKANDNKPQKEVQWSTWGDNYAFPITKGEDSPEQKAENVEYSTWGDNYAYPVSVNTEIKDVTNNNKEIIEKKPEGNHQYNETPEEYYARKIHSTEWTM